MHTHLTDKMCSHVDILSVPSEHLMETENKKLTYIKVRVHHRTGHEGPER